MEALVAGSLPAWQQAKRDSIVAAAMELLRDRSADTIHIREIAERAGAALGTVYRYFPSKEQVYLAVLRTWATWEQSPPEVHGQTAAERLRERVAIVLDGVEADPQLFLMELGLQSSSDPDVVRADQEWSAGGAAWLAADLAGLGHPRAERAATMLWAIVNHVLKECTLRGASYDDARQVVEDFVCMLEPDLDGFGTLAPKE